jgi:hypothetical protein
LFVDPIANIAVLGQPDDQELNDAAAAYDALVGMVGSMRALAVADAPAQGTRDDFGEGSLDPIKPGRGSAYVLSLDGDGWLTGEVLRFGAGMVFEPSDAFVGGMSGSPIIDSKGPNLQALAPEVAALTVAIQAKNQ